MYATIQKWGNSQGLRIPKALLDAVGLKEHDRVELVQMDDGINIRRASATPHRTLEERLIAFYGKPSDQIGRIEGEELDWGKAEAQRHGDDFEQGTKSLWTLIPSPAMSRRAAVHAW